MALLLCDALQIEQTAQVAADRPWHAPDEPRTARREDQLPDLFRIGETAAVALC
jgi:hypothetical protein